VRHTQVDPLAGEEARELGRLTVLQARISPDLLVGGLKNTGAGNLFQVFGEPDIDVRETSGNQLVVEISGLDVYDPTPAAQRVFLTLCAWRSIVAELAIKAAVARPGAERIDVSGAIDELIRSSMVEGLDGPESERFVTVPLAAQLFGRSKLRVSADKASIESDLVILRAFGAAQESDVIKGLAPRVEALLRTAKEDFEGFRATLEYVASHFPPLWLRLADIHATRSDVVSEQQAVAHYVEARPLDPSGWRRLAKLAAAREDPMAEMNALVQLADLPVTDYREISEAANRFNFLSARRQLTADDPAKHVLAERLQGIMQRRIAEADASDYARLGWLCLHLSDKISAREYATRGLAIEPSNRHCQALLARATG
jgi:hypothetical protein